MGKVFLKATHLRRLEDLAIWVLDSNRSKKDIANLAIDLFSLVKNPVVKQCVEQAID
ncbi:MAG: hypothetical protein R3F23_08420 [Verrucomicrobiia bacterium]